MTGCLSPLQRAACRRQEALEIQVPDDSTSRYSLAKLDWNLGAANNLSVTYNFDYSKNLNQTFARCFPRFLSLTGAQGIVVTTQNEELAEQTWSSGAFPEKSPAEWLRAHPEGVTPLGRDTLVIRLVRARRGPCDPAPGG